MKLTISILLTLTVLVGTVFCGEDEPAVKAPDVKTPTTKKPESTAPAAKELAGYETFVQPLGFRFQRPTTWTVQETAQGLLLTPPDAAVSAQGPLESYVITATPCPKEITTLEDARIRQHMTALIQSVLPFLQPVDDGKKLPAAAGTGVRHTWKGTSPTGQHVLGKVYTVLQDGHFFGLMVVGESARIVAREKILETIFSTCAVVKPRVDQRMVGIWNCEVSHASGLPGQKTYVTTTTTYVLLPDGTIHSTSDTSIFGSWRRSPGVTDIWDSVEGIVKGFPCHGRWGVGGAGNGTIYMLWQAGGSSGWSLYIQGAAGQREALLTAADGTKRLWTQIR